MKEIRLKRTKTEAIGQLSSIQLGEHVIYSIGTSVGPHGEAMYWLANRGHFALVQRTSENAHPTRMRIFTYIAQRLESAMPMREIEKAFNPKLR